MSERGHGEHQINHPGVDDQRIDADQFDDLFADPRSTEELSPETFNPSNEEDFLNLFNEIGHRKPRKSFYDYPQRKYDDFNFIVKLYDLTVPIVVTGLVTLLALVAVLGYIVIDAQKERFDIAIETPHDKTAGEPAQAAASEPQTATTTPDAPLDANDPTAAAAKPAPLPPPAAGDPDVEVIKPRPLPPPPGHDDLLARLLRLEGSNDAPDSATKLALQNDPGKSVVACLLEHNSVVVARMPCTFSRSGTGDFMMAKDGQFKVIVSGTGSVRQIYWDNFMKGNEFSEHETISPDADDKACWSNNTVRICARR